VKTLTAPESTSQLLGDTGTVHVVHCDENTALCGLDVTHVPWVSDDEETTCVVCEDLDEQGYCPVCGGEW